MGRLRLEPKSDINMTQERYQQIVNLLQEAYHASPDHQIYWDLDQEEKAAVVRKEFLHVAQKENIPLEVRSMRKARCLSLNFKQSPIKETKSRLSADEAKKRILTALVSAGKPLQKAEILKITGLSSSTWNLRIKDLLDEGSVARIGHRRESVYTLA